jgi:hypothetical protein
MRQAALHCLDALRGIAQRGSDAVADLSSLQRLAQAAADPLIAVGRVAGRLFAGSVGSTTAAALMGGLGVLRLGMGVVKFGMQLMLFLALLYYLLAAQADPLLAAVGVLPLSETGRQRAAVALNRALGGEAVVRVRLGVGGGGVGVGRAWCHNCLPACLLASPAGIPPPAAQTRDSQHTGRLCPANPVTSSPPLLLLLLLQACWCRA